MITYFVYENIVFFISVTTQVIIQIKVNQDVSKAGLVQSENVVKMNTGMSVVLLLVVAVMTFAVLLAERPISGDLNPQTRPDRGQSKRLGRFLNDVLKHTYDGLKLKTL